MSLEVCPDASLLHAFAVGDLPLRGGDEIADHLSQCSQCEATVERHHSEVTEWVGQICAAAWGESYDHEAELQRVLEDVARIEVTETFSRKKPPRHLTGQIGEYEIISVLGRGAMGAVYKAQHQRLHRLVALKVLAEGRVGDPNAIARFCREMKAIGKLDHPNIVQASDAGESDGMLYLAMQFIDGLDMSRIAVRISPMRVCDACEVIRQAAEGLECARRNGIVHRDVKPSNLILDHDGVVRVLDLGLALVDARYDEQTQDLTVDGQFMGTLGYMAPEQLDDSHLVDARADVYALGATLYRLLTGRTPLVAKRRTPLQQIRALATAEPTPIGELRPDLPADLAETIDRMVSRDPRQRLPTPGDVVEAISSFAAGSDLVALMNDAKSTQQWRQRDRDSPTDVGPKNA